MDKKIISIGAIALLIIAGGAFYGGTKYAEGRSPVGFRGGNLANLPEGAQARFQQTGGAGATRGGALFTTGEIISKDDQSVTVKLQDGGSRIIFLSTNTPITKSTSGSAADLTVGEQVVVTGSANQDGSLTAQSIQIGAAPRTFQGFESGGR